MRAARFLPLVVATIALASGLGAAELSDGEKLWREGKYAEAAKLAVEALADPDAAEEWAVLECDALMEEGHYTEAKAAFEKGLDRFPYSLRVRTVGIDVTRMNNDPARALQLREEIDSLGGRRAFAYKTAPDIVALARAALVVGKDPKAVFEEYLDPVKKARPEYRPTYLVGGELALSKNDFALAAKLFGQAAKKFPDEPAAYFGLARAYAPNNAEATGEALQKTLELNPRHIGAQLMVAENLIDSENYAEAVKALEKVLAINPQRPEAHAFLSVIAHLRGDQKTEDAERALALKPWAKNPGIPHLIGTKLSAKYRFAEGEELQRLALQWEPEFLAAKIQRAQDLLRLGRDTEGWALADEVQKADPYDVVAYNLTTLRDVMAKFRVLKSEHFDVKMDPHEAEIYGPAVLTLLERAHETLTKKYGITLQQRTVVEIFPDQKDFAIRTFGLPGGAGFLGVCFGRVITANSPAARPGSPTNWQATLWHEFGHVVTLTLTRNKMPRWLSEGISVYEERQQRGAWGEQMVPRYRVMILGEDLTPLSKLSGAFMRPKSALHLQFAYYESSLVVEWLVQKWGLPKLRACLADLGKGVPVQTALATNFAPLEKLDAEFAEFAHAKARATGPKLDWSKPDRSVLTSLPRLQKWLAENPDNFTALSEQARRQVEARDWPGAKKSLERLIELYPDQHEADSAYMHLAEVHHELAETAEEEAMLKRVAELVDDAPEAYERLMTLAAERKDWKSVLANAERYAAVNPLLPTAYRFSAEAHEALGDKPGAIADYRALLGLDPTDPADVNFRLAKLLLATGSPDAKRHLLLSLEEAPRFRAGLDLLLEMNRQPSATPGVVEKPKQ